MKINPNIFRGYDIRGIYPGEINKEIAYKIGQAFVSFIKKGRKIKKLDILIGRDNRFSSLVLSKAISLGVTSQAANVVDLGVCTTPMFYFASKHYKFDDGGIMITGSHLPKQYNGFKLVKDSPIPIDSETGLKEIKKITISKTLKASKKKGKVIRQDILKEYVKFNLKDFNFKEAVPLKIVIDTGNTPTTLLIPDIFKATKCKIVHIDPDRPLKCTKKENLIRLKKEVLKNKADLGVIFDGDGDRIAFVDEKGRFISPNLIIALMTHILLRENAGEKIIYTVNCSRIIPETAIKNKGVPLVWKIGHSNIKRKMRKANVLFAGEVSGHYYARSHYFSETPFFVLFKILEELSQTKKTLSGLIKPFKKYFYSGEINFKIKDKKKALKALEDKFSKGGKVLKIDGLRIDFKDWWFNARLSNTEPVLRLVVEAKTKNLLKRKTHFFSDILDG